MKGLIFSVKTYSQGKYVLREWYVGVFLSILDKNMSEN